MEGEKTKHWENDGLEQVDRDIDESLAKWKINKEEAEELRRISPVKKRQYLEATIFVNKTLQRQIKEWKRLSTRVETFKEMGDALFLQEFLIVSESANWELKPLKEPREDFCKWLNELECLKLEGYIEFSKSNKYVKEFLWSYDKKAYQEKWIKIYNINNIGKKIETLSKTEWIEPKTIDQILEKFNYINLYISSDNLKPFVQTFFQIDDLSKLFFEIDGQIVSYNDFKKDLSLKTDSKFYKEFETFRHDKIWDILFPRREYIRKGIMGKFFELLNQGNILTAEFLDSCLAEDGKICISTNLAMNFRDKMLNNIETSINLVESVYSVVRSITNRQQLQKLIKTIFKTDDLSKLEINIVKKMSYKEFEDYFFKNQEKIIWIIVSFRKLLKSKQAEKK